MPGRRVDQRDSLVGILRNTDVRLGYQERVVHRDTTGAIPAQISEVEVSSDDPIGLNPSAELWFDPDAPTGPGGTATSEVEISTDEPTNPDAELWFDPDAVAVPPPSINEVWISDTEPTDPNVELWFNPSATLP